MNYIINTSNLIKWLNSERYIIPGIITEEDEKKWKWEISRNRFIDKLINVLKYDDIDELSSDLGCNDSISKLTGEKIKNMERLKSIHNQIKELERKRIEEEPRNINKLDSLYKVYYRLQEEVGK